MVGMGAPRLLLSEMIFHYYAVLGNDYVLFWGFCYSESGPGVRGCVPITDLELFCTLA